MVIMLCFHRMVITKDPVENLYFCYVNIGWMGIALAAAAMFPDPSGSGLPSASSLIITVYVGRSIFGNSVSASLLKEGVTSHKDKILGVLKAPLIIALIIGLVLMLFGEEISKYGKDVFIVLKFIMSFFGMAVLGMWLERSTIRFKDLVGSIPNYAMRTVGFLIMTTIFIFVSEYLHLEPITANKPALYMLCLLPPAANLVILETYYWGTGESATIIACDTCISIVTMGVYALLLWFL